MTTLGADIKPRCPASYSVMVAPARLDMVRCALAGMIWSFVPIALQDGIVFQAGLRTAR